MLLQNCKYENEYYEAFTVAVGRSRGEHYRLKSRWTKRVRHFCCCLHLADSINIAVRINDVDIDNSNAFGTMLLGLFSDYCS